MLLLSRVSAVHFLLVSQSKTECIVFILLFCCAYHCDIDFKLKIDNFHCRVSDFAQSCDITSKYYYIKYICCLLQICEMKENLNKNKTNTRKFLRALREFNIELRMCYAVVYRILHLEIPCFVLTPFPGVIFTIPLHSRDAMFLFVPVSFSSVAFRVNNNFRPFTCSQEKFLVSWFEVECKVVKV